MLSSKCVHSVQDVYLIVNSLDVKKIENFQGWMYFLKLLYKGTYNYGSLWLIPLFSTAAHFYTSKLKT